MTFDETIGVNGDIVIVDPTDPTRRKSVPDDLDYQDLLVPVVRTGQVVHDTPPIDEIRQRARDQLALLHPTVKRFLNPHAYPAGLERALHDVRTRLILEARGVSDVNGP